MSTASVQPADPHGADSYGFSEEQLAIRELAHTIGRKYEARRFDDLTAAAEQWEDLAATGMSGLSLPEDCGGAGGMVELCLALERLGAGGYPASKLVTSTAVAGCILARHASPGQRSRWLAGVAAGTERFCFALTEAGSGSNATRMRTTARRIPGGYRINGEKTYISAVESSTAMLVVAQTPDDGGLGLFVVELPAEAISSTRVQVEAPAFDYQWTLFFDDLKLGDDALVGPPGRGTRALFDGLNPERLAVSAQAIGVGRWCLERAVEYAKQRNVFGTPIGAHQAIQHPLAEAYVALEGAMSLMLHAARKYDSGSQAGAECNAAKIAACDAGLKAADCALQTFGGSGFTDETMMLQRFVYLRLLRSIPVSRELALNHVATAALGLPRSY
jgi:alkylation response protein AidB-like acyl-CoA dehydrogenase